MKEVLTLHLKNVVARILSNNNIHFSGRIVTRTELSLNPKRTNATRHVTGKWLQFFASVELLGTKIVGLCGSPRENLGYGRNELPERTGASNV